MACSIQQVLADARHLVERLQEHNTNADALIAQASHMACKVETMRRYQLELVQLNEAARHRPRASLVLGIQAENRQIRRLQQENKELRIALEEHQSALELIMNKYREQMMKLASENQVQMAPLPYKDHIAEHLEERTEKITEMRAVMHKAVELDDVAVTTNLKTVSRLKQENTYLRKLLEICMSEGECNVMQCEQAVQTMADLANLDASGELTDDPTKNVLVEPLATNVEDNAKS